MMKALLIIALSILCSVASAQQLEPIEADRPDQTETASTVPKGYVQIETGIAYEHGQLERTLVIPTILTKYGITDRFEIRLITEFLSNTVPILNRTITGLAPTEVGLKTNLIQESGVIPTISFIGHLSIPRLGSKAFQDEYAKPRFRFAFDHTLSGNFSIGYNLGMEWQYGSEGDFIYTLTGAYSLSDQLGMYLEAYNSDERQWFDGGLTYLIGNDLLLDLSSGFGTYTPEDYFVGVGASIRFN